MKYLVIGLLVVICTAFAAGDPPDAYIDSLCEARNVAGLSACAFSGDSLIWSGVYGCKNFSYPDSLVNDSTLFYMWSTTKLITAIAFMQLWEDGLVELDADINNYLPYDIRNPYFPSIPITPRMILSHTSSLRASSLFYSGEFEVGDSTYSNTAYIEEVYVPGGIWYDTTANFYNWEPGSNFSYNNHRSFSILAGIIEQVSTFSDSFDLHCREYIFDPLDMDLASYLITSVDTMNVAVPYRYSGGVYTAPYGYPSLPSYAGWLLKSNPSELSTPLVAFMQGGEIDGIRILQETTIDTMMTIQYPELNPNWGLGWRKIDSFYDRLIWGHFGNSVADFGFNAMYFCPSENSAVIVLQNYGSQSVCQLIMDRLFDYVAEETGIETVSQPALAELSVYPNPFTSMTTVSFDLPTAGLTRLEVFDLSGRLVDTLVDAVLPEGGHTAVMSGADLSPGIYFYRLETTNGYSTGRCVKLY